MFLHKLRKFRVLCKNIVFFRYIQIEPVRRPFNTGNIIKRDLYLAKIRPYYDIDLIKVLTGIRRCGKSKILEQIIAELKGGQEA